jgi:hypothetical protein
MCYAVPTAAAIMTTFIWKKNMSPKLVLLMLMFYGGSLFGIIDHLWNGELFLVCANWIKDLALGVVITVGITLAWVAVLILAKRSPLLNTYLRTAE